MKLKGSPFLTITLSRKTKHPTLSKNRIFLKNLNCLFYPSFNVSHQIQFQENLMKNSEVLILSPKMNHLRHFEHNMNFH